MKFMLSLALGAGLMFADMASAAVAPPIPAAHMTVIQVRDGCGRGWHRGRSGECRPDRFEGGWDRHWRYGGEYCGRHYHRNRWGRCVPNW